MTNQEVQTHLDHLPEAARETMESFIKGSENPAELHPDLQECLYEDDDFGWAIKHPLLFSLPHNSFMNEYVNKVYEQKREYVDEKMAERNYGAVVWIHERAYRIGAFMEIQGALTDRRYWDLLGQVWTDSENIWQNYPIWALAFDAKRADRWALMSQKEDRKWLRYARRNKGPIVIHRGYAHSTGPRGMSWTLDYSKAEWFANRWQGVNGRDTPRVATAKVQAADVYAYFTNRGEEEIVAPYGAVEIIETVDVRKEAIGKDSQ